MPTLTQLQPKPIRPLGFFEDTLGSAPRMLKRSPKYETLVRPQMEYCSSVWDPYEKGDVATLEKVQRRAARFVKGDYKRESSVSQMMCDLGWQSLEARTAVSHLSRMYKFVRGLADVESQVLVRSGRAIRQSQGDHYFRNILAHKNCYRTSFFPRTVPEWNHLPLHIRNASSIDCFKSSLIRDQDINTLICKSHYYD